MNTPARYPAPRERIPRWRIASIIIGGISTTTAGYLLGLITCHT